MDAIANLGTQASTPALAKRLKVGVFTLRKLLNGMAKDGRVHLAGSGPRDFHWVAGAKGPKATTAPSSVTRPVARKSDDVQVVWNGASGRHVSLSSR